MLAHIWSEEGNESQKFKIEIVVRTDTKFATREPSRYINGLLCRGLQPWEVDRVDGASCGHYDARHSAATGAKTLVRLLVSQN